MNEPSREQDELAHRVIGAAIEVHRILGPGYLESLYEEAMCIEMTAQSIPFFRQHCFGVDYKGHRIGESRLDFLVGGCLVVELKAIEAISNREAAQVLSYLRATRHNLALLINFNVTILKDGVRRIIRS